ncbi:MAG: prepilin-type N-terminal cleavage/methylation domain-containing protein [Candidatus Levybacteria bacterium]|nr:prepilin-type N-terminal cleavage/methylation domain-containing protein [Candidatus Levybacteria bacterium]
MSNLSRIGNWKLKIENSRVKREWGFTFIEISVVISILSILTTLGIAAFVNYSRNQSLQTAALDLVTTLNLAKSRSFSQAKPPECASETLEGYRVSILASSDGYELHAICTGNLYQVKKVTFPQNITVSSNGTTSRSFFFPVISGGVTGSGSVILVGYGNSRTISVDSVGTVK